LLIDMGNDRVKKVYKLTYRKIRYQNLLEKYFRPSLYFRIKPNLCIMAHIQKNKTPGKTGG